MRQHHRHPGPGGTVAGPEGALAPRDGRLPDPHVRHVGDRVQAARRQRADREPDLAGAFHRAHAERYGYADPSREIELVAVRTADVRPGPAVHLPPSPALRVSGPAVVELPGATVYVPPGWVGVRDGSTTLVVTKP